MDVENVRVAQPVEVAGELLVVGAKVRREDPFLGLVLRVLLALFHPVAGVAGLAPEGCLPVLSLGDGLVDREQRVVFSEESYVVAVVNAVVEVIMLDLADCLLADDLAGQVRGALSDEAARLGDNANVLLWERFINLLADALRNALEILACGRVDHREATADVQQVHLRQSHALSHIEDPPGVLDGRLVCAESNSSRACMERDSFHPYS